MKLRIERRRFVIVRDGREIFCGFAGSYFFKKISDIGNTAIRTYRSEKKARAGFLQSRDDAEKLIGAGRIEFVEVTESIVAPE